MVTPDQWQVYRNLINSAHNSFSQADILWGRKPFLKDEFGEDAGSVPQWITLKALIAFNVFRTWPLTKHEMPGELDNQNMVVQLNLNYLSAAGWLTPQGYFDFNPDRDVFVHMGILYKCEGATPVSQASTDPLHMWLIMERQETETGKNPYAQP